jgi:hypothetical protein
MSPFLAPLTHICTNARTASVKISEQSMILQASERLCKLLRKGTRGFFIGTVAVQPGFNCKKWRERMTYMLRMRAGVRTRYKDWGLQASNTLHVDTLNTTCIAREKLEQNFKRMGGVSKPKLLASLTSYSHMLVDGVVVFSSVAFPLFLRTHQCHYFVEIASSCFQGRRYAIAGYACMGGDVWYHRIVPKL